MPAAFAPRNLLRLSEECRIPTGEGKDVIDRLVTERRRQDRCGRWLRGGGYYLGGFDQRRRREDVERDRRHAIAQDNGRWWPRIVRVAVTRAESKDKGERACRE